MIKALRTVGSAIVATSVFLLAIGFIGSFSFCAISQSCPATVLQFSAATHPRPQALQLDTAYSTKAVSTTPSAISTEQIVRIIQIIGTYSLFIGVLYLLILEMLELHYLKALVPKKRKNK
jgi:hypothetical protein